MEGACKIALEAVAHEPEGALKGNQSSALFLIDSYLGRKQDALALLDRGLLPSEDLPPGGTEGQGSWTMLVQAVEGLWVLHERERAAGLYGLLLRALETETVINPLALRLVQTAAGIGAAAGRLWPEARDHFEMALQQAHEIPFKSEQADVRYWYARMLLERAASGDAQRARRFLGEAIEIYGGIGAPGHVARAERLLEQSSGAE